MDNKQLEKRCDDYDSDLINSTPLSAPDIQGFYQFTCFSADLEYALSDRSYQMTGFIGHDDLPNSLSSDGEVHSTNKQEIDPRKRSTHGTLRETNPFRYNL